MIESVIADYLSFLRPFRILAGAGNSGRTNPSCEQTVASVKFWNFGALETELFSDLSSILSPDAGISAN